MTRFLIVGDLHGAMPKIYFKDSEFDAIIFAGDVCSDNALRKFSEAWVESWGKTDTPYKDWEEYIDEYGRLRYEKIEEESTKEGRRILKFLSSFNKPVYFIPGNWDNSFGKSKIRDGDEDKSDYHRIKKALDSMYGMTNKKLIKGIKNIVDCQFTLNKGNDFNILGYGNSSWPEKESIKKLKDKNERRRARKVYDKILNKLSEEYSKRDKRFPTIFLSHNIPNNTKMDKIIKKGSVVDGQHYGSTVARDFINKHHPLVCISGHMHEYFGKEKVGKTTVINCGFGPNVNTLLEVKNGKIKNIKFVKKDRRKQFNKKVGWR